VVVRNLFYNTPARMKFLKRDATEAAYVVDITQMIAAANPHTSVAMIRDGDHVFKTPGDGNLKATIFEIFKEDVAKTLIEVDYEMDGVRVWGYISSPAF